MVLTPTDPPLLCKEGIKGTRHCFDGGPPDLPLQKGGEKREPHPIPPSLPSINQKRRGMGCLFNFLQLVRPLLPVPEELAVFESPFPSSPTRHCFDGGLQEGAIFKGSLKQLQELPGVTLPVAFFLMLGPIKCA
jgi:hypothetical protein